MRSYLLSTLSNACHTEKYMFMSRCKTYGEEVEEGVGRSFLAVVTCFPLFSPSHKAVKAER